MAWKDEPRVDFPAQVKSDQERSCEVGLEETFGRGRSADWEECDVELGDECEDVDEEADVRAPDAKGGLEWELVEGVAVGFPVEFVSSSARFYR